MRCFAASATPAQRSLLADAIINYAAAFPSDAVLEERLFSELGCYYMPSGVGLSCKEWLAQIAEKLT